MFHVHGNDQVQDADSREEAVAIARELSENSRDTVVITDDDEQVRMVYRGGSLNEYVYRMRRGRH